MDITIWHNPGCGTSRTVFELLKTSGHALTVRNYLKDPPTEAEIAAVLTASGLSALELLRKREPEAAAIKTDAQALAAMAANAKLIERPVLIAGQTALLGRPPTKVADWLKTLS
jgi:arsenate reductase (glutaredoxin)